MDLRDRPEDVAFRQEVRHFLAVNMVGEFAELGGRGGSGDETFGFEVRRRWEKVLAEAGWTCLGWPAEYGGRGASMAEQVIFNEEYARAAAPGRVNVMGEGLLGPTLIHYGTPAQKARFLPPIREGTELWCQGYSEPDAGSDLANVKTRAERDGDEWVVTGQKVWTSLAHQADWCFVVCRTDPEVARHKGLSYLLVPMDQPGVEVRPITQLTRTSEFNEVFFDGARTSADNVVGEVGDGWRVALATLAFERGVALLGHQLSFRRELDRIVALAESNGRAGEPVVRQRLAQAHIELTIMRWNTLRSLAGVDGPVAPPSASVAKLFWASWHRRLGELAMDIEGVRSTVLGGEPSADNRGYGLDELQRSFLFARSETIYGGSNQIQRNIIGERVLGLPGEPKGLRAGVSDVSDTSLGGSFDPPPPPEPPVGHGLLEGRVVVVTAAAGTGIGSATARRCLEEGASVVVSDAHERRLGETAEQLVAEAAGGDAGRVLALPCDVRDEAQVGALYDGALARLGRLDACVHNAGLGGTVALVDMTDEQWSTVLDITLTGTFRCTRAALRRLLPQRRGVIVNNASVLGWRAQPGQAHYAAAKAGVMALTRCAAAEGAPFGVRVNVVSPSLAEHPFLNRAIPEEDLAVLRRRELYGRGAETWEVANVIVFLASDYSSYMSGEIVSVSSQHP